MTNNRGLHPGAWWIWALGLSVAATLTLNPWVTGSVILIAIAVVYLRRSSAPWAMSFKLYLWLALAIVFIRIAFRVLLGQSYGGVVLLDLPEVSLPKWAAGISLLGPITSGAILSGLYEGMQLAAIVISFGAANTLANPKRLLKSLPPALYEIGTAVVVALSVFPQLGESINRVRRAQDLRSDEIKGLRKLRRIFVPVLEDAFDRSLILAAGMDVRGYGRSGGATKKQRTITGAFLLGAIVTMGVGFYALLDQSTSWMLAWPVILLSLILATAGFYFAGKRVTRTRYRPDPWEINETFTAAAGMFVPIALAFTFVDPVNFTSFPTVSWQVMGIMLVGFAPLIATPQPQAVLAR